MYVLIAYYHVRFMPKIIAIEPCISRI